MEWLFWLAGSNAWSGEATVNERLREFLLVPTGSFTTPDAIRPGTIRSPEGSQPVYVGGSWKPGTKAGRYYVVLNDGKALQELASFDVVAQLGGTFVAKLELTAGTYGLGASAGSIAVYSGKFSVGGRAGWSIDKPDAELTRTMFPMTDPH